MAVPVDRLDSPRLDLWVSLCKASCPLLARWLVRLLYGGPLAGDAEGYGGQELDPHRMPEFRLH
jgi:hypothetical protein